MSALRGRQRGMSLVVAIFLIVVIALLAAFAVTAGTSNLGAVNLQLQADRARAAARAGAQWGAYRARVANSCLASSTFNLAQGALRGFRVTVRCSSSNHLEGVTNYYVRDIDSFAQFGNFGAVEYASAGAQARVSNAP